MLTLTAGDTSLVIAPEGGGAMVGWTLGAVPILRRADPEAIVRGEGHGLAGFPLVPFSNRIGNARFTWEGRTYELARNFGDEPHAIHGVGWQTAWEVAEVARDRARLALNHDATGARAAHWPFPFSATLGYVLSEGGLDVALAMTNRHTGPAPAGLGLHPYFMRTAGATLRFAATGVWRNGADKLPEAHVAVPPEWDHTAGKPVGTAALDNLFTGWDGRARIDLAPEPVAIEIVASDIFRRLVVYTPAGARHFCVEPVSHDTDAINRLDRGTDTGLRILQPGETLQGTIAFRLIRG